MLKQLNIRFILLGIISISYGICLIFFNIFAIKVTVQLLIDSYILFSLIRIGSNLVQKKFKLMDLIPLLIGVFLRILNTQTQISSALVLIAIGVYQLMLAVIYGVTYILYRKNNIPHRGRYLFDTIVLVLFGIQSVFSPLLKFKHQFLILGVYLILIGIRYLREGLFFAHIENKTLKRKIRIHVPIIFEALIPGVAFNKFNEFFNRGISSIQTPQHIDKNVDLEIFVHAMEGFQGATGHVDICFENTVISYGCYDTPTARLFGTVSDGTLIKCERTQYLEFCQYYKDRVFAFGISLNSEQKQAIKNRLQQLDATLIPWDVDMNKHEQLNTQTYQLKQRTNTKFYKFKESKFKTYFVATTNCVQLADTIIGEIGTDILNIRGVITPGTYLNYLNTEYQKENSFVVSKHAY